MSKVAGCKRKLKTRTITEKYKIIKKLKKENHMHQYQRSMAFQSNIVWMVKRKNKKFFRSREKQNFCEKSQDATLPIWRFRQSMLYVAFTRQNIIVSGTIFKVKALYFLKMFCLKHYRVYSHLIIYWYLHIFGKFFTWNIYLITLPTKK